MVNNHFVVFEYFFRDANTIERTRITKLTPSEMPDAIIDSKP